MTCILDNIILEYSGNLYTKFTSYNLYTNTRKEVKIPFGDIAGTITSPYILNGPIRFSPIVVEISKDRIALFDNYIRELYNPKSTYNCKFNCFIDKYKLNNCICTKLFEKNNRYYVEIYFDYPECM